MAKYLETKYSKKAGSQGGGSAMAAQLGKTTPHGRDLKASHPDRTPGSTGKMGQGSKYTGSMEKSYKNP